VLLCCGATVSAVPAVAAAVMRGPSSVDCRLYQGISERRAAEGLKHRATALFLLCKMTSFQKRELKSGSYMPMLASMLSP
jgi:hypothetical protein